MAPDSPGLALLLFPLLLGLATAAGAQLLRLAAVPLETSLERSVFAAATGLGTLSYASLAIGLLGAFNRTAFLLLLLTFSLLGAPSIVSAARGARSWLSARGSRLAVPGSWSRDGGRWSTPIAVGAVAAGVAMAVMTLVAALAPPGGNDWDGLAYHLAAPKVYLRHGRIHFIPYDSHTNFPFTMEMLYGLGLSLAGAPLAKLFHWGTGALTALALIALCRRGSQSGQGVGQGALTARGSQLAVGSDEESLLPALAASCEPRATSASAASPAWTAPLAAALFLTVPQVAWEATTAYIDLGMGLFQLLALYALLAGIGSWSEAGKRSRVALFGLAGAMSGWAMGTKMTAMLPFGLLVLGAGVWAVTRHERAAWRAVAALVVVGVVIASPWYIKSTIWTNNPVYPFFYRLFPHSVNWTEEADRAYRMEQNSFGLGHDLKAFLWAPWNTAMEGSAYFIVPTNNARHDPSPRGRSVKALGDVLGSVGLTLLAFLPLWLFTRRAGTTSGARGRRWVSWLIAYVGASMVLWFLLTQQTRYLLPVLAPASLLAAMALAALPHGFLRVAAGCSAAIALSVGLITTGRLLVAPSAGVVFGQESRDAFLTRTLPDLYPAMQFVNMLPNDSRIAFLQEARGYYADRDYFWANPLQNTLIPYETFPNGAAMAHYLRDRLGLTHVLFNANLVRGSEGTAWYRQLEDAIRSGALIPLYQSRGVGIYSIR